MKETTTEFGFLIIIKSETPVGSAEMFSLEMGTKSSLSVWHLIYSQTTQPRVWELAGGGDAEHAFCICPEKVCGGTPCSDSTKSSSFKEEVLPFPLYKNVKHAFKGKGWGVCRPVISHLQGVHRAGSSVWPCFSQPLHSLRTLPPAL